MARSTFDQLNDALFAELDRLAQVDGEEAIEREIERANAVSGLARNIIGNASTAISLMKFQNDTGLSTAELIAKQPKMLNGGD